MRLVCNANVLFAAILKNGTTRKLLVDPKLELLAPDFIRFELEKYHSLLCSRGASDDPIQLLFSRLTCVKVESDALEQALLFSPDLDDASYLALCLQTNLPLWSNDRRLKEQPIVQVYNTKELYGLLSEP